MSVPKLRREELVQAVVTYKSIKQKIEELEGMLKAPKAVLEAEAMKQPEGVFHVEHHTVKLVPGSRENFSIKTAREEMTEGDFKKHVAPLITVSHFTSLRVS
jgi:hypothetical protein